MAAYARAHRLSPWGRLVTVSALLVVGSLLALTVAALASLHRREVSYAVRGDVENIGLDLGDADVVVSGGGDRTSVQVERTERFAFGHDARTTRTVSAGRLDVRSRCPRTVLHSCMVAYRVSVPDNVPVTVATGAGAVRFAGYRGSARITTGSGDIRVAGFCGFSLRARSTRGAIDVGADCAPPQLSLRSTTGDVRVAVPTGRYQVDAESASGARTVHGVTAGTDAPFTIQALSSSGDVDVEGR